MRLWTALLLLPMAAHSGEVAERAVQICDTLNGPDYGVVCMAKFMDGKYVLYVQARTPGDVPSALHAGSRVALDLCREYAVTYGFYPYEGATPTLFRCHPREYILREVPVTPP